MSNVNEAELTPSNQSKSPQIFSVREEGHKDEAVEVQTLNKDPVVVSCQEVHEQGHHHLAANLRAKKGNIHRLNHCFFIISNVFSTKKKVSLNNEYKW